VRLSAAALIPEVKVDVAAPVTVKTPLERDVEVAPVVKRFVKVPEFAKILVAVAFPVVAFPPTVSEAMVLEPRAKRLPTVARPILVLPRVAEVAKRLVEDAVEAKLLVEVLLVVVPCKAVKFWRVDEPVVRSVAAVTPPVVMLPKEPTVAKRLVLEAVVAKKLVLVPFPLTNKLPLIESLSLGVEEPIPTNPLLLIVRADMEEVAKASLEVAKKSEPPAERAIQCLRFAPALVSVRANCGAVDDAS